jgi:hypothetical protein
VSCASSSTYLFWQQIQKPFQNRVYRLCNLIAISIKISASNKHFQNMS